MKVIIEKLTLGHLKDTDLDFKVEQHTSRFLILANGSYPFKVKLAESILESTKYEGHNFTFKYNVRIKDIFLEQIKRIKSTQGHITVFLKAELLDLIQDNVFDDLFDLVIKRKNINVIVLTEEIQKIDQHYLNMADICHFCPKDNVEEIEARFNIPKASLESLTNRQFILKYKGANRVIEI